MGTAQTALTLVQPIAITQISYSLAFLLSLSSIFFFLSFLNLTSKPHFATLMMSTDVSQQIIKVSSLLGLHDMFQENSTAFPSATAVMKSSR